jgi:hypothetical protein
MNHPLTPDDLEMDRNDRHGDGTELRQDYPIAFHRAVAIANEIETKGRATCSQPSKK